MNTEMAALAERVRRSLVEIQNGQGGDGSNGERADPPGVDCGFCISRWTHWSRALFTLGEILLKEKQGREGDEMVYFNAVGLPVLDVFASRLFKVALEKNLGVLLGSQIPH